MTAVLTFTGLSSRIQNHTTMNFHGVSSQLPVSSSLESLIKNIFQPTYLVPVLCNQNFQGRDTRIYILIRTSGALSNSSILRPLWLRVTYLLELQFKVEPHPPLAEQALYVTISYSELGSPLYSLWSKLFIVYLPFFFLNLFSLQYSNFTQGNLISFKR